MFDEQKLFLSEKVRLDLVHAVMLHLTTTHNISLIYKNLQTKVLLLTRKTVSMVGQRSHIQNFSLHPSALT